MQAVRKLKKYDHRLVELVRRTGDIEYATRMGVPRTTAAGWTRVRAQPVVTAALCTESIEELQARVARLEKRVQRLRAIVSVVLALLRIAKLDLSHTRVPDGSNKRRLLRAIDRCRGLRGAGRVLGRIGLSPSRLSSWRRSARECDLDDTPSCPTASPQRLTPGEVASIRDMVTSPDYRHVPTGRLSVLAQRLGRVFASTTTWYRLVKERGWRRPRLRQHPCKPRQGVRTSRPNELWHIDATVIRLLDGSRVYLSAVIDNYSRRILAWRVGDRLSGASSVAVLVAAAADLEGGETPRVLADAGPENRNAAVDQLIESGLLTRVLAMVDIHYSNSLIEAWWRTLKHNWLYLHSLDSLAKVKRLVAFYVDEHNSQLPHSAFKGQTPDEMYFGKDKGVAEDLAARRAEARQRRLEVNRAARCGVCI